MSQGPILRMRSARAGGGGTGVGVVRWQSPEVHDIWVDSIRFIKHNYDSMGHPVRSSDPRICGPHCGA